MLDYIKRPDNLRLYLLSHYTYSVGIPQRKSYPTAAIDSIHPDQVGLPPFFLIPGALFIKLLVPLFLIGFRGIELCAAPGAGSQFLRKSGAADRALALVVCDIVRMINPVRLCLPVPVSLVAGAGNQENNQYNQCNPDHGLHPLMNPRYFQSEEFESGNQIFPLLKSSELPR